MPENIFLSGEYTWIRPEGEYAVVGLNEYILYDHMEVCSVELPEPGEEIEADGYFCSVETLNGYVEIYAPVSGQIMEINDEVCEQPELINMDPYGPGWLAIIAVDDEVDTDDLGVQSHWWQELRSGRNEPKDRVQDDKILTEICKDHVLEMAGNDGLEGSLANADRNY
jgi:glycine cleavage system H protein